MKYEPSEGSMMIDISTIYSLELVQNLRNPRSKDCLFGLLNETQTPMGARLLRSNVLQPLTDTDTLVKRYDAVDELQMKEDIFHGTRAALKNFLDADKILTAVWSIPRSARGILTSNCSSSSFPPSLLFRLPSRASIRSSC